MLNNLYFAKAKEIIERKGAYREKVILKNCHFEKREDTWTNEHKVIEIIANEADEDGHVESCEVDIVTGRITG